MITRQHNESDFAADREYSGYNQGNLLFRYGNGTRKGSEKLDSLATTMMSYYPIRMRSIIGDLLNTAEFVLSYDQQIFNLIYRDIPFTTTDQNFISDDRSAGGN